MASNMESADNDVVQFLQKTLCGTKSEAISMHKNLNERDLNNIKRVISKYSSNVDDDVVEFLSRSLFRLTRNDAIFMVSTLNKDDLESMHKIINQTPKIAEADLLHVEQIRQFNIHVKKCDECEGLGKHLCDDGEELDYLVGRAGVKRIELGGRQRLLNGNHVHTLVPQFQAMMAALDTKRGMKS